jgi:hypothetical protein
MLLGISSHRLAQRLIDVNIAVAVPDGNDVSAALKRLDESIDHPQVGLSRAELIVGAENQVVLGVLAKDVDVIARDGRIAVVQQAVVRIAAPSKGPVKLVDPYSAASVKFLWLPEAILEASGELPPLVGEGAFKAPIVVEGKYFGRLIVEESRREQA